MLRERIRRSKDKCDSGLSVENVPAVGKIKTLKGRFITHKFTTGWVVGVDRVVKSVQKKKGHGRWSVRSEIEVRTVLLNLKTKQGRLRGRQVLPTLTLVKE
jgi:hypothetical protein